MKECKYNDYSVRFVPENEVSEFTFRNKYDFALFENGIFDRRLLFERSKNQLIFYANNHLRELGNCEKFIIVENGIELILLWTSLKGKPEKTNMRGGKKELMDYLFLTFTKRKSKCLYIGNSVEAALAGWRNSCSLDIIYIKESLVDEYLKQTTELYLPF